MKSWAWTGDTFASQTSAPLSDRGFRYGMSLFESVRVHRSTPVFFEQHLARLHTACNDRGFALPAGVTDAAIHALLAGAGTDGFARIYVTAGEGTLTSPATACRLYIFLEQRAEPQKTSYTATIPDETYKPLFGGLKTANYWSNAEAMQRAAAAGFDEALLFNDHAELISGSTSNVFLVHQGKIRTPSLSTGAREGVLREWIISSAPVKECSLFINDVMTADEAFISNSWVGIMPLRQVDSHIFPSSSITDTLSEKLKTQLAG